MHTPRTTRRAVFALATLSLSVSAAFAAPVFDAPDVNFNGRAGTSGGPFYAGSEATVGGVNFRPGQQVTLSRGGQVLNHTGNAYIVDEKGEFKGKVAIPADAVAGPQPVVVQVQNPTAVTTFNIKVSPQVPLSGQQNYNVVSQKLVPGLYQVAKSEKTGNLFVTSAVGRPPVKESKLLKLNGQTFAVEQSIDAPLNPARNDGHRFAVYGVGVDDTNGTVWVTETRDDSVAVYRQSDLSLVKRFDKGSTPHARDVVVHESAGKAYASSPFEPIVSVYDTRTLQPLPPIALRSQERGGKIGSMSLALDAANNKLYTVSLNTAEAVVIDTRTDKVEKVFTLWGAKSPAGVAVDPKTNRLFVASQGSDNLLIVDIKTGKTLHNVPVGAGALNVAFDPASGNAYVVNRAAGTVTAVDANGRIVANLPGGTLPNHVMADGRGSVYAINKARGANDAQGDRISQILPK